MSTKRRFTSATRTQAPIEFDLDGDPYTFQPPKVAPMLLEMAGVTSDYQAIEPLLNWLGQGLTDDEGDRIVARLKDPDDPIDIDTVIEVTKWLSEEMTDRPTKPSFDSTPSHREATTSTDGVSLTTSSSTTSI